MNPVTFDYIYSPGAGRDENGLFSSNSVKLLDALVGFASAGRERVIVTGKQLPIDKPGMSGAVLRKAFVKYNNDLLVRMSPHFDRKFAEDDVAPIEGGECTLTEAILVSQFLLKQEITYPKMLVVAFGEREDDLYYGHINRVKQAFDWFRPDGVEITYIPLEEDPYPNENDIAREGELWRLTELFLREHCQSENRARLLGMPEPEIIKLAEWQSFIGKSREIIRENPPREGDTYGWTMQLARK
jgi:hypothetical protein